MAELKRKNTHTHTHAHTHKAPCPKTTHLDRCIAKRRHLDNAFRAEIKRKNTHTHTRSPAQRRHILTGALPKDYTSWQCIYGRNKKKEHTHTHTHAHTHKAPCPKTTHLDRCIAKRRHLDNAFRAEIKRKNTHTHTRSPAQRRHILTGALPKDNTSWQCI